MTEQPTRKALSAPNAAHIAAAQKAATILRREADAIEEAHTVNGDWKGEEKAKADAAEMRAVADELFASAADTLFAHRLANELECVLLDGYGGRWHDGAMAVLSEYREAESIRGQAECPTQFGEPAIGGDMDADNPPG